MLKIADVKREVERIEKISWDFEDAHSAEDRLYKSVLDSIAMGHTNPKALARAALKTAQIEFTRCCA